MWEELGISGGTAIIVLIALYFVIRSAVKSAIISAYEEIKSDKADDDEDSEEQE